MARPPRPLRVGSRRPDDGIDPGALAGVVLIIDGHQLAAFVLGGAGVTDVARGGGVIQHDLLAPGGAAVVREAGALGEGGAAAGVGHDNGARSCDEDMGRRAVPARLLRFGEGLAAVGGAAEVNGEEGAPRRVILHADGAKNGAVRHEGGVGLAEEGAFFLFAGYDQPRLADDLACLRDAHGVDALAEVGEGGGGAVGKAAADPEKAAVGHGERSVGGGDGHGTGLGEGQTAVVGDGEGGAEVARLLLVGDGVQIAFDEAPLGLGVFAPLGVKALAVAGVVEGGEQNGVARLRKPRVAVVQRGAEDGVGGRPGVAAVGGAGCQHLAEGADVRQPLARPDRHQGAVREGEDAPPGVIIQLALQGRAQLTFV